jgi:hypothetical protein
VVVPLFRNVESSTSALANLAEVIQNGPMSPLPPLRSLLNFHQCLKSPVWMYMDPVLLQHLYFGWIGFTVADVYPASVCGQKYHRREPRWISACFLLIGSKTSTFALPVHTSGLRSYGMCRLTIPCQVAAILSGISSCFCLVVSFPQAVCGVLGPRYSSFLDKIDQIIRAFLFAIATATIFGCRRSRI